MRLKDWCKRFSFYSIWFLITCANFMIKKFTVTFPTGIGIFIVFRNIIDLAIYIQSQQKLAYVIFRATFWYFAWVIFGLYQVCQLFFWVSSVSAEVSIFIKIQQALSHAEQAAVWRLWLLFVYTTQSLHLGVSFFLAEISIQSMS